MPQFSLKLSKGITYGVIFYFHRPIIGFNLKMKMLKSQHKLLAHPNSM